LIEEPEDCGGAELSEVASGIGPRPRTAAWLRCASFRPADSVLAAAALTKPPSSPKPAVFSNPPHFAGAAHSLPTDDSLDDGSFLAYFEGVAGP